MPDYSGPLQHVELARSLWLIPFLPALGALLNAIFGTRLQKTRWLEGASRRLHIGSAPVTLIAVLAMAGAFALSVEHVLHLAALPESRRYLLCHLWQMVRMGSVDINFDLALDPLSSVVLLVITGIGLLIHVYAAAYMAADRAYWRFFSYLNLFVFSMLLLVLGDGFVVMFFGWEGVGLCSYLLIGFWYQDYGKASAGMKAFVTNRVGDWGFLTGLFFLFWGLGGAWFAGGEYQPDNAPRFEAVEVVEETEGERDASPEPAREREASADAPRELVQAEPSAVAHGDARLTMTALPGAEVYLDGAREPFAVSPFVELALAGGPHTVRIARGGGFPDDRVNLAGSRPGAEIVLAPVGPTFAFRQIHDQLVVRNAQHETVLRDALTAKTVGGVGLVTIVCLFFFVGATGKSAQIPLYVWLPDAMAGPTPVSALIHAATMVTAGVYMIARLSWLFSLSPTASAVVASVGALTALFAASIGFFQYDIKKVLAYSTVSQLGFMFIGVGTGAYWAGVFHLVTHACFKACLFLGSGSVIHGMHAVAHGEAEAQDMRNMGGLRRVMPLTALTYKVACLAITAAPIPFFAGFWSKDEILWKALNTGNTGALPGAVLYVAGLVAAAGTSFYMWRSYFLTFEGEHARPAIATSVHESPAAMTWVLAILALLSTFAGATLGFSRHLLGGVGEPLLERWLAPSLSGAVVRFSERSLGVEYASMALSVVLALSAYWAARLRYGAGRRANWAERERTFFAFELVYNKYWVDELYQSTIIAWVLRLRLVLADMDRWVVDGLVNAAGGAGRAAAWVGGAIDHYIVDGAVNEVADVTLATGERLRKLQTGHIQSYLYGLLGGVALLFLLGYLLHP